MDPDQIVILDNFFEFGRKVIVDPEISGEVAPRKLGEVQSIMQNRPQHPIGEPVIVFLIIMFGQIGDDVFDVLVFDGSRSELVSRPDFSAPSEPHASVVLQRWPQRHLKPAGALGAIAGGNRNPIGYDRQARQYRPQAPRQTHRRQDQTSRRNGQATNVDPKSMVLTALPLVIGQNGRNNGGLASMLVRRKTTFHSSNQQNVRWPAKPENNP